MLGAREDGFRGSLEVLNEGGPPLLAHSDARGTDVIPGERYGPVGTTDDQGAYIYVPILAKTLGLGDPLDALRVLYLALFAVPLILYPLVFYGLFRSLAAAVVAPVGLGVVSMKMAGGSFGQPTDIYWVGAWAALALLPPLLLIDRRRPRGSLALIAGIAVAASFATSIRTNSGLGVVLTAALVIFARKDWSLPHRGAGMALLAVAYLSVSTFGLSAVREYRDDWVDSPRFSERAASLNSHPVWHNAYIGLGYFPNDFGIFYSDTVAADTVKRLDPDAAFITPEYERVLRARYFDVVGDDPGFFLLNLGGKLVVTAGQMLLWLVLLAVIAPFALAVGSRAGMMRRCALLLAPAIALALVPSIGTAPYRPYELGLTGALALCSIILLTWLAAETEELISRSPRGGRLARLRSSIQSRPCRRQAGWVIAAVLLAIALSISSKPLQRKADNWQIEHGGIPLSVN